jgi:uncharacterized protein YlxW (UPF0749 family)
MVLQWERPPEMLARDVGDYMERVMKVALIVATDLAQLIQGHAQDNARWTDRTGNARQGLTGMAEVVGTSVVITLFHTMDYGIWLEVAHSGNYAIIMETLHGFFQQVIQELQLAVKG